MDMGNSCSKKYLFKTRKRGEVDFEGVAYGHVVSGRKKGRKKSGSLTALFWSHPAHVSGLQSVYPQKHESTGKFRVSCQGERS